MGRSVDCSLSIKGRGIISDTFKRSFGCLGEESFAGFEKFTVYVDNTPSVLTFGNLSGRTMIVMEYFKERSVTESPQIHIGISYNGKLLKFMDIGDKMFCGPFYPTDFWYVWTDDKTPRNSIGVKITSVPGEIKL